MKKILYIAFVFAWISGNSQPIYKKAPRKVIVNGFLDSRGFFRFYSKKYLFNYYGRNILNKIEGDFYFYKEGVINGEKEKQTLVYSYLQFSFLYPNVFNDKVSIKEIKKILLKKEFVNQYDMINKKNFIVEPKISDSIFALSETSFFEKYVDKQGLIINTRDDAEQIAVILRLLRMNISVSVLDISGDLMIPNQKISIPVW